MHEVCAYAVGKEQWNIMKPKTFFVSKRGLDTRHISSTLTYTRLVNLESDEYHTATSKSLERDEELLAAGFKYVTDREGVKIYRKRKQP